MSEIIVENWNSKSDIEKEIFIEIMKSEGEFKEGDVIADGTPLEKGLGTKLCKIACSAAQAAAITACSGNAVCIAAAVAAGEACRREC